MSLIGGKRKVNKSLKAWVAFVKRVQKQEKLTYKDAIHRAKVRKDKGEKWMHGGEGCTKMGGDDSMKMDNQPSMGGEEPMKMSGGIYRATGPMKRSGGRRRSTAKKSKRKGKMTKKRRTRRH
jgi:hypothetical protein